MAALAEGGKRPRKAADGAVVLLTKLHGEIDLCAVALHGELQIIPGKPEFPLLSHVVNQVSGPEDYFRRSPLAPVVTPYLEG